MSDNVNCTCGACGNEFKVDRDALPKTPVPGHVGYTYSVNLNGIVIQYAVGAPVDLCKTCAIINAYHGTSLWAKNENVELPLQEQDIREKLFETPPFIEPEFIFTKNIEMARIMAAVCLGFGLLVTIITVCSIVK